MSRHCAHSTTIVKTPRSRQANASAGGDDRDTAMWSREWELNPRPADCSGKPMLLILLALSCVLHHCFAWYSGLVVPFLFPSRDLLVYMADDALRRLHEKNILANVRQIRRTRRTQLKPNSIPGRPLAL